jgi:hypothetical protein
MTHVLRTEPILVVASLLVGLAVHGCSSSGCNSMGVCTRQLAIEVQSGPCVQKSLEASVSYNGVVRSATCTGGACSGALVASLSVQTDCSGYLLEKLVLLDDNPSQVTYTINVDGGLWGTGTLIPTYREVPPSGQKEECGVESCIQAQESINASGPVSSS